MRQGITATDDPVASPGTYHPVVCTHPETGRQCLYLGRRRNAYIEGLSLAESEALLDELWSYATREELSWYNTLARRAIWCCGTTAARCIGAIRSMPPAGGSCIARR